MTETVFVTGASGFLAKHVILQLLRAGQSVRGSLRTPGRADEVRDAMRPHLAAAADLDGRLDFVTLDLDRDDGWAEAMRGSRALIHTASPFPLVQPKDPAALIGPARDGTLRALGAARAAGIEQVVLTSSIAAVTGGARSDHVCDEDDWTDAEAPGLDAYSRSKTLAERAAWEYATAQGLRLTTINPGFIVGPPLDRHFGSSVKLIRRILAGRDPMMPALAFNFVDVRDVALAHLRALERPAAVNQRFVLAAGALSLPEVGRILKAAYPDRRIPTRQAPNLAIRLLALFDAEMRAALPMLGVRQQVSSARAQAVLGIDFTPPADALRATAEALIAQALV